MSQKSWRQGEKKIERKKEKEKKETVSWARERKERKLISPLDSCVRLLNVKDRCHITGTRSYKWHLELYDNLLLLVQLIWLILMQRALQPVDFILLQNMFLKKECSCQAYLPRIPPGEKEEKTKETTSFKCCLLKFWFRFESAFSSLADPFFFLYLQEILQD